MQHSRAEGPGRGAASSDGSSVGLQPPKAFGVNRRLPGITERLPKPVMVWALSTGGEDDNVLGDISTLGRSREPRLRSYRAATPQKRLPSQLQNKTAPGLMNPGANRLNLKRESN
jgi:hypothetical protein